MSDGKEGDDLVQKLEELAKKKESEPPRELTNDVVINLAGLTPLQYAQQIGSEAKKYRTTVKLLDKAVEAARHEQEARSSWSPIGTWLPPTIRLMPPSCSPRSRRGSSSTS